MQRPRKKLKLDICLSSLPASTSSKQKDVKPPTKVSPSKKQQHKNEADNFAEKAIRFYKDIKLSHKLPNNVIAMNPYLTSAGMAITSAYYHKFFSDNNERVFVLGINPGRFGCGITGLPFTDPKSLTEKLGIPHNLKGRRELSGEFIYEFIEKSFGIKEFFSKFYISALSPLGFTKDGKNYNFYDDSALQEAVTPFMKDCILKQYQFGASKRVVICLGGKLTKFFKGINEEFQLFDTILTVEHPRYIIQYKRKNMQEYIEKYKKVFLEALQIAQQK